MITLVFSPQWFYGVDIIFELLGVLTTILIGLMAYRSYYFTKEKKFKFFAFSFWAITLSFLAKIATNFVLYYHQTVKSTVGDMLVKYNLVAKQNFFYHAGYDLHRFFMLLGFFGIYWVISKSKDREHQYLFAVLFMVVSFFSFGAYYIFQAIAALILLFTIRHYYDICVKQKNKHAYANFIAFTFLFLSQIVFVFTFLNNQIYVIGESLQLIGFVILLANMIAVFIYGKKKNKN